MPVAASPEPGSGPTPKSRLRSLLSGRRGVAFGLLAVTAVVAVTLVALGGEDRPAPVGPNPRLLPAGAYFGAHTRPEVRSEVGEKAAVEALEAYLGRRLAINHSFFPWTKEFPTESERADLAKGRIPMISWNGRGAFTSDIAAGRHDVLITDRARGVKRLSKPVLIRWFWEMDGNKKAEWAQSPKDYIAAWRHIVDVFEAEGATNVQWVWCPNASSFADGEAQAFYPGDAYVDWLCADGYNWAPGRGDNWRSFSTIFSSFYDWASQKNMPIMVGEFGVQEGRSPGEKAAWIIDLKDAIKTKFPLIKAVIYFNVNGDYDWRMNTSDSAYQAFKDVANDPWFDGTLNAAPSR